MSENFNTTCLLFSTLLACSHRALIPVLPVRSGLASSRHAHALDALQLVARAGAVVDARAARHARKVGRRIHARTVHAQVAEGARGSAESNTKQTEERDREGE